MQEQKNEIEIKFIISYESGNARLVKVLYSDSINIQDLFGIIELYKFEVSRKLNENPDNNTRYSVN